ncbi:hypothetical protein AB6A40_004352 [Gnathostoma spinigerum]|uniref:5'-AMP-activated protein kinase subunit beta-1 n=1 Tax=Gnathostoma spinigerum TaxID=75299 RepID=A0ABD6ECD6_9BILA
MGGIITCLAKFVLSRFGLWEPEMQENPTSKYGTFRPKSDRFTTTVRWIAENVTKDVKIALSTQNWKPVEMRKIDDKTYLYEIYLPEDDKETTKTIEFKFLVDGIWQTSNEYETCPNEFGTVNNVITAQY